MVLKILVLSPMLLASALGLVMMFFIARNRRVPGARALLFLTLGASVWALGYTFELSSSSLGWKIFWAKFEYLGIAAIPLAWFIFVVHFLNRQNWLAGIRRYRIWLLSIPAITLLLAWTNEYHGLIWEQVELQEGGSIPMLGIEHGPWFWVYLAFSYCLLLWGSILLARGVVSRSRLQRWQIILALTAIALPWLGNLIYVTGSSPIVDLDLTPVLFVGSGVLFAISLFNLHFDNIVPIAQKKVFANLSDCLFVLDTNGCIVGLNPVAQELVWQNNKTPLGEPLSQVFPPIAGWLEQERKGDTLQREISLKEGPNLQCYELRVSNLTGVRGVPIGRLVVLHDITRYKQEQAELMRSRQELDLIVSERTEALRTTMEQLQHELTQRTIAQKQFAKVIESAPDAMFLIDQTGEIVLTNLQAERLFGYSREELLGKNILEWLAPENHRSRQAGYLVQYIANPKAGESSYGFDLYAQDKNSREFPVEVGLSYLETEDSYWVVVNVRDISERKQAESELRRSQQTYQALFENAADGIFLVGLEGKIHQVNQKAANLLEYNREELQAMTIYEIIVPAEHPDVQSKLDQMMEGGILKPYVRHYRTKSGKTIPIENNVVLVRDSDGQPRFYQNIARDISDHLTALREQERLLREIKQFSEQMRELAFRLQEAQEHERQALAAELHDRVGQNLTGLSLNLQIIQNQLGAETHSNVSKRLQESVKIVESTTHLVRDVMAELDPPTLREYGLTQALEWYSSDFASRTGIAVCCTGEHFETRLPPNVEKVVFRIIQEALNNVAKHARATQITIHFGISEEASTIGVEDDGQGFDPEEVFRPSREPRWGLLTMQQRAASIGATLAIDTVPGRGSTVILRIPEVLR